MHAKSWRIGVDTTTRNILKTRSDITSRLRCKIPVTKTARRRDGSRQTPAPADPNFGPSANARKMTQPGGPKSGSRSQSAQLFQDLAQTAKSRRGPVHKTRSLEANRNQIRQMGSHLPLKHLHRGDRYSSDQSMSHVLTKPTEC
jgi:hypothetical protein